MRITKIALALAISASALSTPAFAQTRAEQARWDQAQRRFDAEQDLYERERQRYEDASRRGQYRDDYRNNDRYGDRYGDDAYVRDYDASRYYRDDPRYQERTLGANDQVYRGSDGRYYCRRNDGTTGLVIGAGAGALIGRAIDGGRSRAGGTIVGGVLGALLGRTVEQQQDQVRCR
jgi:hypothetical protein